MFTYLNMTLFIGSQSFISLPSFMFVGSAFSEIRESNRKKEEEEEKNNLQNGYFHLSLIDPFFHQSYLLTISTH